MGMGNRYVTQVCKVIAAGITFLVINDWSSQYGGNSNTLRRASSDDNVKSYSGPGSITAVLNTAKMGTGGLFQTIEKSWECHPAPQVEKLFVVNCKDDRRSFRTHYFDKGTEDIQKHRERHPEGKCLIVTAIRSPASWFASMYLQSAKRNWKPKEEMLQDFRSFLASGDFHMLHQVLPDLLKDFYAGSLIEQTKIMDENGGYSLIGPAPPTSVVAGCDLLFLRMEQSERWPEFFQKLGPGFRTFKEGESRIQQHPEAIDQIKAIASYKLTSEEKISIYNRENEFIRNWFDSYGYMDDVVDNNLDKYNDSNKDTSMIA